MKISRITLKLSNKAHSYTPVRGGYVIHRPEVAIPRKFPKSTIEVLYTHIFLTQALSLVQLSPNLSTNNLSSVLFIR
jgi:hypothetical protein